MTDRRSNIHRRYGPVAARRMLIFVCASLAIGLIAYPTAIFTVSSPFPDVSGLRVVQWISMALGALGIGLVLRMYRSGVAEIKATPSE